MALPEPGFIYWGLFVVCGAIWAAYALWMVRADAADARRETRRDAQSDRGSLS